MRRDDHGSNRPCRRVCLRRHRTLTFAMTTARMCQLGRLLPAFDDPRPRHSWLGRRFLPVADAPAAGSAVETDRSLAAAENGRRRSSKAGKSRCRMELTVFGNAMLTGANFFA